MIGGVHVSCFNCHGEIYGDGILVSADGDFVCSETCRREFEAKRDDFLGRIVHDPELCERWLRGEDV